MCKRGLLSLVATLIENVKEEDTVILRAIDSTLIKVYCWDLQLLLRHSRSTSAYWCWKSWPFCLVGPVERVPSRSWTIRARSTIQNAFWGRKIETIRKSLQKEMVMVTDNGSSAPSTSIRPWQKSVLWVTSVILKVTSPIQTIVELYARTFLAENPCRAVLNYCGYIRGKMIPFSWKKLYLVFGRSLPN